MVGKGLTQIRTHFQEAEQEDKSSPTRKAAKEKMHKNSNLDMIVSLLGANDIVCRHANGHISPRFLEVGNCVEVLTDKLTKSRDFLMNICDCVILSHLVGMDLDRFNKFETNYTSRQDCLFVGLV